MVIMVEQKSIEFTNDEMNEIRKQIKQLFDLLKNGKLICKLIK